MALGGILMREFERVGRLRDRWLRLALSRFGVAGARRTVAIALASSAWLGQARAQGTEGPRLAFQPGFHQVLRIYTWRGDTTTFRMKVPVGRSGNRVRVSFKAGEYDFSLRAANVALAGAHGQLASDPIPLTFNGQREAIVPAMRRLTSDPVNFSVAFGAEVYVSFEGAWAIAVSTINAFPDSYTWPGSYSSQRDPPPGTPYMRAIGLNTIDVEGPSDRAVVAIGDSITEGFVSGDVGEYISSHDDYRDAWPAIAQGILRVPFANAGASAQGIDDALEQLGVDVLPLQGITDCVVLLGTNDLHALSAPQLEAKLAAFYDRLRPFCRIWGGTLPPVELTPGNPRVEVNDWIRRRAAVADVIDFESVLAAPGDVNRFRIGLGSGDGIHPSVEGQHAMGAEAARVMAPPALQSLSPNFGPPSGGTVVFLSATGLKRGARVFVGGTEGMDVVVSPPTSVRFTTPPHEVGSVDVSVTNPDGQSSTLLSAFRYQAVVEQPNPEPEPGPGAPPATPPTKRGCSTTANGLLDPAILAGILLALYSRFGNGSSSARKRSSSSCV